MRIGALASAANSALRRTYGRGACLAAGCICQLPPGAFIVEYSLGANPMIHDLIEESSRLSAAWWRFLSVRD
jgi:hypothetical protein